MKRSYNRDRNELRPVEISRGTLRQAEGSALIKMGYTEIICTATVEDTVPPFLRDTGKGWVTAEYSMLPRATAQRNRRDSVAGKISGRSHEIQRIIGRVLRSSINLDILGERSIIIDCDVVQADGGTRTASITGGFVALYDAISLMLQEGELEQNPISEFVAAVSVGIVDGELVLDMDYEEDSRAGVDLNVAMDSSGGIVEIQGTAEGDPFSKDQLDQLINLAEVGVYKLIAKQKELLWE